MAQEHPTHGSGPAEVVPAHTLHGTRLAGSGGVTNLGEGTAVVPYTQMRAQKENRPREAVRCRVPGCNGFKMRRDSEGRCAGHAGVIGGRKHRREIITDEAE